MVTLLVVGGPFPPSPNYEQAPPRLTHGPQETRSWAKASALSTSSSVPLSGWRCPIAGTALFVPPSSGSYWGNFAARTSTALMTGGCASSPGA